jgi:hypothetical protein
MAKVKRRRKVSQAESATGSNGCEAVEPQERVTKVKRRRKVRREDVAERRQKTRTVKVKRRKRRPDSLAEAAAEKQQVRPAERLQLAGRGFRLGFGSLPGQRKLTDSELSKVNKEDAKVKKRMLKQAKALFDKHPAITAANSAKNAVETLFQAKTLPFPEPGVRLFMLELAGVDLERNSEEEINSYFGQQLESFAVEIQERITAYEGAVQKLQAAWPDVLKVAEEALEDLYSSGDYPAASQVLDKLYCNFRPYNIELPKEYGYVSPLERQRAMAAIEKQFEEAVRKQEEFVIKYLSQAIEEMIESVKGYHDGEQRSFTNARIGHVFDAFREFKEKTVRYGILEGTALEQEFKRAEEFMRSGGLDEKTLPATLRKSAEKREDLMNQMVRLKENLVGLSEARKRRAIRRD